MSLPVIGISGNIRRTSKCLSRPLLISRDAIRLCNRFIMIYPQAFATIKSTTGISDIEEIAAWLR